MSNDPWKDLVVPSSSGAMNSKRISAKHPWNFFWACSYDHRCILLLSYSREIEIPSQLPRLKGIELKRVDDRNSTNHFMIFSLLDLTHKDIFYKLCSDIVDSSIKAASEKEAVSITLNRTWRWHHLLRGGGSGRLSPEEQKGLIGELIVIEKYLLPNLEAEFVINSWHGPLGAPKDFEIQRVGIEVKARRSGNIPHISISSEYQLDDTELDSLFLNVVTLDQASSVDENGFSLTDMVSIVRERLALTSPNAVELFETRLVSAGFDWQDDYSDSLWIERQGHVYQVSGDFPRIVGSEIYSGVINVRYHISLDECAPFMVSADVLLEQLRGPSDVN